MIYSGPKASVKSRQKGAQMEQFTPRAKRLIRRPEVERRVGLRRAAIYKAMAEGRFPTPVKIGPRAVAWVESDIDAWILERVADAGA